MISPSAEQAFSSIFSRSVEEAVYHAKSPHQWEIKFLSNLENIKAKEFILLTMCSYGFRLFTTLHFTYNRKTIQYIASILNMDSEEMNRTKFYDCLGEYGNIFCGSLKRELGKSFPHLGMSTPDLLEERSFRYFENLKYEYELHSIATSEKTFPCFLDSMFALMATSTSIFL